MNTTQRSRAPAALPQRMAATDALFWYAETALPIFRPIIAALYIVDRHPDPRTLAAAHEMAQAAVPRLHQRVVEAPLQLALPEWVDDPHFDPSYHVRHLSVPEPGRFRELLDLTAALFATPLDRERPLWEAYWIDGLEGGRTAYFFKMHHSLVDGVGSVALLNALTQPHRSDTPHLAHARRTPVTTRARSLAETIAENAREWSHLVRRAVEAPLRFIAAPVDSANQLSRIARGMRGVLADVRSPLPRDPLVGSSSGLSRRFDVLQVPLERLHAIRKPLGVSLNDLVLAALAGTLHAYHRERHVHADVLNCMVPMNLRGNEDKDSLGNRVGMFTVQLPVGERRVDRRLPNIVRQTHAAKSDRRGALYPFLVQTLNVLPGAAFRWLAQQSLGRVNVACTNVPGVPERRYMAGAEVQAIYPFASVVQGTPLVMALFSYAGTMDIGIDTDPEAIANPHRIGELFLNELDDLAAMAARMQTAGVAHPQVVRLRTAAVH